MSQHCAHVGIERPVVFGHSAGGFVALHLQLRHPDLASGLILCDSLPTHVPIDDDVVRPTLSSRAGADALAASSRLFGGDMSPESDEHGDQDVAYVFAGGRSGETPKRLLGGPNGTLIVDGYSGYNVVAEVSRRKRAACHAHLRRYFHEALPTAPIAQEAIDLILGLYRVEHDAKEQQISGSQSHLRLRRQRAGPIRDQLHQWLLDQKPRHPPKSPISTAIRYALNQWRELGRFLDDARVPLDNNASERSLRRVALGRKNYLFVGDVEAGASIAGLYTFVATCEARGINPFAYLSDVIPRVQDHPKRRIDDLLPGP